MAFYIVRVDPDPENEGQFIESPLPNYGPYKTGVMAAKFAKKVGREIGAKVMPRRVRQAPETWRERAAAVAAEAQPMPKGWDLDPIEDHFPHPSVLQPGMISYTPDEAHGVIGKVKNAKPGAYLKRFYKDLDDPTLRRYAAMFDEMTTVRFARTPQEIEWVYENGVSSCMVGKNWGNKLPCHPCSIYGAGDLAVAWTPNGKGGVAERVLCWPKKKIYSQIYGDGAGKLGSQLMDMGYQSSPIEGFAGARLLRVFAPFNGRKEGGFVMPYIDLNGGSKKRSRDDGEFLIIDPEGPILGGNTQGIVKAVTIAKNQNVQFTSEDEAILDALEAA